jgi:hypothetical protein
MARHGRSRPRLYGMIYRKYDEAIAMHNGI